MLKIPDQMFFCNLFSACPPGACGGSLDLTPPWPKRPRRGLAQDQPVPLGVRVLALLVRYTEPVVLPDAGPGVVPVVRAVLGVLVLLVRYTEPVVLPDAGPGVVPVPVVRAVLELEAGVQVGLEAGVRDVMEVMPST